MASAFRFTCYRPVVGQYVTIRNVDDTDPHYNYGYLFPLTIQEIKVIGKRKSFPIISYCIPMERVSLQIPENPLRKLAHILYRDCFQSYRLNFFYRIYMICLAFFCTKH